MRKTKIKAVLMKLPKDLGGNKCFDFMMRCSAPLLYRMLSEASILNIIYQRNDNRSFCMPVDTMFYSLGMCDNVLFFRHV